MLNSDYYGKNYEYPTNGGSFKGIDHARFATAVENLIHALARTIRSDRFPEKLLPMDPVKKGGWHLVGSAIERFGRWLKKLSD